MADYFQSTPNFVNPSYATPEQLAMQRAYAAELTKRSGENVNRPTGAIANVLNALTAGLTRNNADAMQAQGAARNSADLTALISQLQSGKVDPATAARIVANPLAAPEHRALVTKLIEPQKVEDVAGRPGYISPSAGVQATPINGPFQPGFRAPESAGSVSTVTPIPAPMPSPRTPTNPNGGMFGGLNYQPAGWNNSTAPPSGGGPQAPVSGPPAAAAPAASVGSRIDALAAKDRELSAEKKRTEGGAEGEAGVIKQDVENAALAPETLKGLGIIKDNITRFGDKITFGPTSQFTNELKRLAANYAPGPMKDQLTALAAADSIEKVNLGLAGALAKQIGSGTQGELFKAIGSTPGMEKSKEGALALIDMLQQSAMKQQALGQIYQSARGNLAAYQMGRQRYLTDHPVVNPLTGNPVEMDIETARKAAPRQNTTGSGPASGTIMNGFRFKGGNPNDKANWEPIS